MKEEYAMVFSSPEFLFAFLPLTLLLYFAVPKKHLKWRNVVLLVMSLLFYGWGEPRCVLLMVFTIAADYGFGFLIAKSGSKKAKKVWLTVSVVANLAILGYFKYASFIVNTLASIPGLSSLRMDPIPLPVGISFYTFQALSYVIDVYRGDTEVQKDPAAFGTYVTLFPQLVAGPIVRYRDVDDMLLHREETTALRAEGVRRFALGLAKKCILGNVAGEMWSSLSAVPPGSRTVLGTWMALLFYTFHIYFDFSAYSDMAIGLGKMFGFSFLENFNYPYISRSITEFWRRWHISLSGWFREYLYFPLGGSRCDKKWKTYRNLFIVWLATGIWHGANWNFIAWGLYYFVLLVIEKTFLAKKLEKLPSFFSHLYTMLFVTLGWGIFALDEFSSFGEGLKFLAGLVGVGTAGFTNGVTNFDLVRNLLFLLILAVGSTEYPKKLFVKIWGRSGQHRALCTVGLFLLFALSIVYLIASGFNPFLYYRF